MALSFLGEEPVEILLERAGQMPLPPYIASKRATDARDRDDYQTMFARDPGAGWRRRRPRCTSRRTSSPRWTQRAIGHETLTLHVGAGTFLPVKADDTGDHRMHAEWGRIDAAHRRAAECGPGRTAAG